LQAAYLATGLRLEQALDKVPRLLPPQISAMLTAGVQIGDIAKVLPACRRLLSDSVSQTRGALNYLVIWAFLIAPICPFLIHTVNVWVFPKMLVVTEDILESAPPVLARSSDLNSMFVVVLIAILLFFQLLALCYVGGPRVKRWARFVCFGYPMADKLELLLPWRRKRLQRDFSAMLAILLDAGVPEKQSLLLAAESTANELFQRRAAAVSERLQQGTKLTEAVEQLDDAGEFRWRLANAAQAHRGFMAALSGWLESLDAKAFQQEQAAAQGLSTVIVLVNGAVVGVFAYGVFQMLTLIVQGAGLW
jgi:type II secretory pathway component PulF